MSYDMGKWKDVLLNGVFEKTTTLGAVENLATRNQTVSSELRIDYELQKCHLEKLWYSCCGLESL
jgi:hypothetical protein